jgi:hypothetical protein
MAASRKRKRAGAGRGAAAGGWHGRMQRRERFPENALAKGTVCILQMRLRLPLEVL